MSGQKKAANLAADMTSNIHSITSCNRTEALDLVKWVYAVAKIPADSPRFAYYVSRWDIPGKIARAKATGTFESAITHCPPIDPAWLRFAPAALDEHRRYMESIGLPLKTRPSSNTKARPRKTHSPLAA